MISAVRYSLLIFSIALLDVTSSFHGKYKYYPEAEGWIKGHAVPLNFQDAMIMCHLEGAVLASPLTEGLHKVITNLISGASVPKVYTGINALHNDKYFSTVEGIPLEELTYYMKDQDELREDNGKHCFIHNDGFIERANCYERYPYLCYIKKEKEFVSECGSFVNNYVKFETTGKCYKYHAMKTDYKNAYLTCQAQNAHLLTLSDEHIGRAVKYIKNLTPFLAQQSTEHSAAIYEGSFKDDLYLGYRVLASWFRRPITDQGELLEDSHFDLWNDTSDAPYCGVLTPNLTMRYVNCTDRFPFICQKDPLDKEFE